MVDVLNNPGGAMQVSRGIVVATIQGDLDEPALARLRHDLLDRLEKSGCQGVILDLSGLHTLDAEEFADIRQISSMASLMGAQPVLAGLRSGVVSALIDSGVEVEGIQAAVDLDAAFEVLLPALTPPMEAEVPDADADAEADATEDGDGPGEPS